MKAEKKQVGTKAEIRAIKERERRLATALFLALILLIAALSVYFSYTFLNQPQNQTSNQTTNPTSSQLKAAIVDQLSLTLPNQTFIQTATNTLKQAGYTVDYYSGENVTVEFYRNLPTYGYRIIILRVHSSITQGEKSLGLFTSERYDSGRYVYEQLTNRLLEAVYSEEERNNGIIYFAISPTFVTQSMNGRFNNATIIMMGCEGLTYTAMAEGFHQKGAKVYISWSGSVSASHTDTAITHLLQHYLIEERTLKESVQETFKEVGFDPAYNSLLIYYPLEVGEQTIENINNGS